MVGDFWMMIIDLPNEHAQIGFDGSLSLWRKKKTMTELRYEGRIEILCFRIESSNKKEVIKD